MLRPPRCEVEEALGTELVSGLRIKRGRDENGVTRPSLVNLVESSVILSDHEYFVLVLLPGDADQPVVEERQVRIAHGADDHGAVLSCELNGLSEGVVAPLGLRRRERVWEGE